MLIDYSIVTEYLENKSEINKHWIFNNIVPGENKYEEPDALKRGEVEELLKHIKEVLVDFKPFNEKIYTQIYPHWRECIRDMRILLIVGAPEPYEAMVRTHGGKEYIIFDLIRFGNYIKKGFDAKNFIRKMITHETSHLCIKKYYPMPKSQEYIDILKYITFNEGIAHLLAYEEGIDEKEYETIIDEHYDKACLKLRAALEERDTERQEKLLIESNSGAYWDKFAAISGKLFLLKNLSDFKEFFDGGVDRVINKMMEL